MPVDLLGRGEKRAEGKGSFGAARGIAGCRMGDTVFLRRSLSFFSPVSVEVLWKGDRGNGNPWGLGRGYASFSFWARRQNRVTQYSTFYIQELYSCCMLVVLRATISCSCVSLGISNENKRSYSALLQVLYIVYCIIWAELTTLTARVELCTTVNFGPHLDHLDGRTYKERKIVGLLQLINTVLQIKIFRFLFLNFVQNCFEPKFKAKFGIF